MRDLQQGLPEGPEPAAPQERPQRPLEAARPPSLKLLGQARLCVPGAELRAPRPEAGAWGLDRDQEALQPEARGEAVEVREVREEIRGGGGLEGAHQDLRAKAVHVRLWERLCEVRRSCNFIQRTSWANDDAAKSLENWMSIYRRLGSLVRDGLSGATFDAAFAGLLCLSAEGSTAGVNWCWNWRGVAAWKAKCGGCICNVCSHAPQVLGFGRPIQHQLFGVVCPSDPDQTVLRKVELGQSSLSSRE